MPVEKLPIPSSKDKIEEEWHKNNHFNDFKDNYEKYCEDTVDNIWNKPTKRLSNTNDISTTVNGVL